MVGPAIVILSSAALPLARQVKQALGGDIHHPHAVSGGDVVYDSATACLARLFREKRSIIGLCASGILIRAIGPYLSDKHDEPAVVALSEDGRSVVPLLGGHHGANALARSIASLTQGHAAITTAGDLRLGLALEEPRGGYVLANPQDVKTATAALLQGQPLALRGGETLADLFAPRPGQPALHRWSADFAGVTLTLTTEHRAGGPKELVYHPQSLVVGIGCERGTAAAEVQNLIDSTLSAHNLSPRAIAGYASLDLKADEPALAALSPTRYFTAEELIAESSRLHTPSAYVMAEVGTPGVAEAAALAAAPPESRLIVAKTKSRRATCAIAQSPRPITALRGSPRGVLSVVGLGPGTPDWRSPAATKTLQEATEWVGYDLYLDLAADVKTTQVEHRFPLGGEEDRVRHAITLARQGRNVALVCSGDAGIYAMAALVYEVVDLEPCRISITVVPGISAFQAAAARAGAMIGHDFCCISLSDLLTPWDRIEKRLQAAAEGDFVIAFYNPRSRKRVDQLQRAFDILRPHRPPETPVVIASNLGRPEEEVRIVPFRAFNPEEVDMLTLVMVGSSQTKSITRGDGRTYAYTPRGYAKKRDLS
jgi:cobalt-precorrin 5A hydrolase/precorrin-3B C17-methyltransferase